MSVEKKNHLKSWTTYTTDLLFQKSAAYTEEVDQL